MRRVTISLRPGEYIASESATVIVDESGSVTGWIDNETRLLKVKNVERQA